MSLLYNRIVAVHRQDTNAANQQGQQQLGMVGYSGREDAPAPADVAGEFVLFTNLPAYIRLKRSGRTHSLPLPADSTDKPIWDIGIRATDLPQYSIRDRDIIVDDEGYRYMVIGNYWTFRGYQIETIRLEA